MRPIRPKVPIVPTLHVQQIRLMKLIVPTRSIRPEMPIEQVHLVPIGVRLITVKDRKGPLGIVEPLYNGIEMKETHK